VCYKGGREKEIRKRKGNGEGWWCHEVRREKKGKKGEKLLKMSIYFIIYYCTCFGPGGMYHYNY
jgi:hypothetical protein